jgi:hypothetical protein
MIKTICLKARRFIVKSARSYIAKAKKYKEVV